jgi:hypothetical protein
MTRQSQIEAFFEPMVGKESKASDLLTGLRFDIAATDEFGDPFNTLRGSVFEAMRDAARANYTNDQSERWLSMAAVGQIGVGLAIESLRTLGELYEQTSVPQQQSLVRDNAGRTMRHIRGIAFRNTDDGIKNAWGVHKGISPNNPLIWLYSRQKTRSLRNTGLPASPYKVDKRAFRTKLEDGQLIAWPRHKLAGPVSGLRCPATNVKVDRGERRVPALSSLLGILSEVAVTDIYPGQFPIIPARLTEV